jgi:hypothetical protein
MLSILGPEAAYPEGFLCTSRQILGQHLKIGHDRVFLHPSKFIIYNPSLVRRYIASLNKVRKKQNLVLHRKLKYSLLPATMKYTYNLVCNCHGRLMIPNLFKMNATALFCVSPVMRVFIGQAFVKTRSKYCTGQNSAHCFTFNYEIIVELKRAFTGATYVMKLQYLHFSNLMQLHFCLFSPPFTLTTST